MELTFFTKTLDGIVKSLERSGETGVGYRNGYLLIQKVELYSATSRMVHQDFLSIVYQEIDNSYDERFDGQVRHRYFNRRYYKTDYISMIQLLDAFDRRQQDGSDELDDSFGMTYRQAMEYMCEKNLRDFIRIYTPQVRIEHLIKRVNDTLSKRNSNCLMFDLEQAMAILGCQLRPGYYVTKQQADELVNMFSIEVIEAYDLARTINVRRSMTIDKYCERFNQPLSDVINAISADPTFAGKVVEPSTKLTPSVIESLLYMHFDDVVVNRK
jgi:hypothetical protein